MLKMTAEKQAGLCVDIHDFCTILTKIGTSQEFLIKLPNVKFRDNLFNGSTFG
jgi:hypothetical protein